MQLAGIQNATPARKVMLLMLVLLVIVGVVFVVAPPAHAGGGAPCYAMGHYNTTWTSHGTLHWAQFYYHESGTWPIPDKDYYRIYHRVGGKWVLVAYGSCTSHH